MLGTEILYTAAQTRALDHCAIDDHSIPGITLMSRAAERGFRLPAGSLAGSELSTGFVRHR